MSSGPQIKRKDFYDIGEISRPFLDTIKPIRPIEVRASIKEVMEKMAIEMEITRREEEEDNHSDSSKLKEIKATLWVNYGPERGKILCDADVKESVVGNLIKVLDALTPNKEKESNE